MVYVLACGDVMPACQAHFEDDEEDGLVAQVLDHARQEHEIMALGDHTEHRVRNAMRLVHRDSGAEGHSSLEQPRAASEHEASS